MIFKCNIMKEIFNILTLFSLFIIIILSCFFILTKKGNKKANIIIAIILLLFGFQIFYSFAVSNFMYSYFMKFHKILFLFRQISLLFGPLIYFYIYEFYNKNELTMKSNPVHFIPFILSFSFLLIYLIKKDDFVIWKSSLDLYDTLLILIHNISYIIASIIIVVYSNKKNKILILNNRNSTINNWLSFLIIGFIAIWIINLNSFATYMIVQKPKWCAYTASIFALSAFLFINSIMLLLLLKPEVYHIIEKYRGSILNDESKIEYLSKLNTFMMTKKPYLDPDMTLNEISNQLSLNPRIISQIINELYDNNIRSYINEFRIKESMKLLLDSNNRQKTILEILYEAGFNSKSVFNLQFKKYSGLTPQEFREKYFK